MKKIDGPFRHGRKWRLRIRERGKPVAYRSFGTEEETVSAIRKLTKEAAAEAGLTVAETIEEYEEHLSTVNKPRTVVTSVYQVRQFFVGYLDTLLTAVTPAVARQCAKELTGAPDTRLNALARAKAFIGWSRSEGLLKFDPLENVKVPGQRRRGKPQLTEDESRKLRGQALRLADEALAGGKTGRRMKMGQLEGALGTLVALWMGPRASEVTDRQVRDLDRGGEVFVIPTAKTRSGIRRLKVPAELRPYLLRLTEEKLPTARLFGDGADRDALRRWCRRICKLAGVPVVGPHSLRGTHGSLAMRESDSAELVSRALGHASTAVTTRHYATEDSVTDARQRRVDAALGA